VTARWDAFKALGLHFAAPRPTVLATADRGERYVAHAESTLVCAAFLAAGADLNGKGRRVGSNAKETTNV